MGDRGKLILEKEINERTKNGLSREDVISELYKKEIGERKPMNIKPKDKLEYSVESLQEVYFSDVLLLIFYYLLSFVIIVVGLKSEMAFLVLFGLLAYFTSPLVALVLSRLKTDWEFKETIKLEKSANCLPEIKKLIPSVFQRSTLQKIFFSYDDDNLEIRFKPDEKFDPDVSKLGLSEVNVNISFKTDKEDLLLDVAYHGSHFRGGGNVASRVYRKVVLEFRSNLNEVVERAKSEKVVNFSEIVELIAKYGVVVKEIKCPECGGKIELPKEGSVTKCPYCGATIEAIDVYKIIKDLIKDFP